jgi:hypothetical protein
VVNTVNVEIYNAHPISCFRDMPRIFQVVVNLLGVAHEHSPQSQDYTYVVNTVNVEMCTET